MKEARRKKKDSLFLALARQLQNSKFFFRTSRIHRFLWAFVCFGVYLFVTSAVGLVFADLRDPRRRRGVSAHRHMLIVAVLFQLAVALALFCLETKQGGDTRLAGLDITGAEAKLARAVRKHTPLARGVALAIFAVEIADRVLATALFNAEEIVHAGDGEEEEEEDEATRAAPRSSRKKRPGRRSLRVWGIGGRDDDGADDEEAEERGGSLRLGRSRRASRTARGGEFEFETEKNPLGEPLLDRAGDEPSGVEVLEPFGDGAFSDAESESAVWARRMRSKYNLDVTRLAYDPERLARRAEPGRAGEVGGKCVVM
jgi:hypothetical protein